MPEAATLPDWPAAMREDMAAAYLSVGATWFRERVAPAVRAIRPTPGVVLYRRADLDAWLDRQAGGGAASRNTRDMVDGLVQELRATRRKAG